MIECVNKYKYLGIILSASGIFKEARNALYNKALKVCFKLYKDLKSKDPSIKTLLHLFDHIVKPILLYGGEIWGLLTTGTMKKELEIYDIFKDWEYEKLHVKFCKYLLGVNKRSTNIAALSELGRLPLCISHIVAMFSYWLRLENVHANSLLHHAFKESTSLSTNGINSWFSTIDYLKNKIGLNFNTYKNMKPTKFKSELKKRLRQIFFSYWHTLRDKLKEAGKLSTYFDIKDNFHMEKYLHIKKFQYRQAFCKLRISAHNLRIETGRYEKERNDIGQNIKLDRSKRVCQLCNADEVEDECHFLLTCSLYNKERETLLNDIYKDNHNLYNLSDKQKLVWILRNVNISIFYKVCNFLVTTFETRSKRISENKRNTSVTLVN